MTGQPLQAVIFDLDGVLVMTEELHYQSWKEVADAEGIPLDRAIMKRLRGMGRRKSLDIILERAARPYTNREKESLATLKNGRYRDMVQALTPADIVPGAVDLLQAMRRRGVPVAVGSSSRNARLILEHLGIAGLFDAIVDGNDITASKPDPAVFLRCAELLGAPPETCIVVEDAEAGIEAARRAGMTAIGIGEAAELPGAARVFARLGEAMITFFLGAVDA
jgi:beta-phosphoglucomutase